MRFSISLLMFCSCLIGSARADFIYSFGKANYQVLPNSTVDVEVFLTQVAPGPISLSTDGLFSAGVRVHFDELAPSDGARVQILSHITPSPLLDDTLLGPQLDLEDGVSAGFVDSVDDIFAPLKGDSILLGVFRFTSGSIVGEVTNLRATDFGAMSQTIAGDDNFTALDSFISDGNSMITVMAVPEPSSIILVSTAVAGLLAHHGRRRKSRVRKESGSFQL